MDTIEAIHTRRSIRKFQDRPVPEERIREVIAAAMMAPSARDARPWQFVVIDDPAILAEYAAKHPNAAMARGAPVAILICGDLGLERSAGYWPVDCAAAAQNLLLEAAALGLGAVPIGAFYDEGIQNTLGLPSDHQPLYLIPVGHPQDANR